MNKKTILFITNGNAQIGMGHLTRDVVIAKEFQKNNWHVIMMTPNDFIFGDYLSHHNQINYSFNSFQRSSLQPVIEHIKKQNNVKAILIDLVEKEYDKLRWLKDDFNGILLISITLFLFSSLKRYENITFYPNMDEKYNNSKMKFYSGPSYFVFRDEFQNKRNSIRKNADRILITMGGTDPFGLTLLAVKGLIKSNYFVTVLLSKHCPYYQEVVDLINMDKNIKILNYTNDIAKEMIQNDVIILNGGLTRYEACITCTPFIAISIHMKQFNITKKMTKLGIGVNCGVKESIQPENLLYTITSLLNSYEIRLKMSQKMNKIFDLNGAKRIFQIIDKNII